LKSNPDFNISKKVGPELIRIMKKKKTKPLIKNDKTLMSLLKEKPFNLEKTTNKISLEEKDLFIPNKGH
jgi:hypothetical protein